MKNRKWSESQLIDAVKQSQSLRQSLRILGLKEAGGNYQTIRAAIKEHSIDTSHWLGQGYLRGKTHNWGVARPFDEILVQNKYSNSYILKKRLIKAGLLINKCYIENCGLTTWLDNTIQLHLDHINGVHDDNRIENLRLLCPNCHSQTPTYCGKNKKKA